MLSWLIKIKFPLCIITLQKKISSTQCRKLVLTFILLPPPLFFPTCNVWIFHILHKNVLQIGFQTQFLGWVVALLESIAGTLSSWPFDIDKFFIAILITYYINLLIHVCPCLWNPCTTDSAWRLNHSPTYCTFMSSKF